MERIDEAQVYHIARLSRLHLTESEATQFTEQLAAILAYASHVPEFQDHAEFNALRLEADEARPTPNPQSLLRNAMALESGYVKVPAILDRTES